VKTCYTCIVNNYDDLKEPINKPPHNHNGWQFICYTDNPNIKIINAYENEIPKDQSIWQIKPIEKWQETIQKTARWYKINYHEVTDTEESLWIDATFFINTDLNRWWRRCYDNQFTVISHPFDDCAYKDIQSCISAGKGDMFKLMEQALDYRNEGLPVGAGLISSGILMRKKHPKVVDFCKRWWAEVEKYTERDQPCFTYTAWKEDPQISVIQWDYTQRDEFIHVPHVHKVKQRENRFKTIKKSI
jgi:hypothetical protein